MWRYFRDNFVCFARREDGTTAIEFSLMVVPYVFLVVGIIELSLMYASAAMLEGATGSAARLIRTGQIQQPSVTDPQQMFEDAICSYATVLINCNDVQIEVVVMASYNDFAGLAPSFNADGDFVPAGFNVGGVSDRVLVRTAYRYSMATPLIGNLLAGPDNSRMFMSTVVLQTEPYEFQG